MNKKDVKNVVKECVNEMMGVGIPPAPKTLKKKSDGIEKTIKTTNQVIDALASGRIDAATAKKLIEKIAREDISKAVYAAGSGCQY